MIVPDWKGVSNWFYWVFDDAQAGSREEKGQAKAY
jgi:hypothetical protein